jgi:hypothetical protein
VSLFIGFSLFELGRSVFMVSSQTHAGGLPTSGDVSVNFGRYSVAAAVGQLFGPLAAGVIIDTLGFRFTWLVMGVLCTVVCALVFKLISRGLYGSPGNEKPSSIEEKVYENEKSGLRRFFSFYAVIGILTSAIIVFTVGMRGVFYPIYVEQLGYTASVIGIMLSIRALTSVLARLFIIPITRLLGGRLATLLICMMTITAGLGTTPFCRNFPALVLNSVLIGMGVGLAMPMSLATVFESVKSPERGLAVGVRLTVNRLAQFANPLLFGLLTQCFGISVAFWSAGIILFVVAVLVLLVLAWKRRVNNRWS